MQFRVCFFSTRFTRSNSGAVAPLFGLLVIVLFATAGGAIDFGRWSNARQQTVAAMDAAVLAAGRALQLDSSDVAGALAKAEKVYNKNILNRLPTISDTITFVVTDDNTAVTATGNAEIETFLLKVIQIDKLTLLDGTGSDYSKAELAVNGNAGVNIEVSMMLDVTGSMEGDKIEDMKTAAKDLIDIVVWDNQSTYTSKIAIIPFAHAVNVGPTLFTSVTGKDPASYTNPCAVDRTGSAKLTDDAPGPGKYVDVYEAKKNVNHWTKYLTCNPLAATVQPLTNNKLVLKSLVNSFVADGYTAGHIGTAFAWYALSPNWSGVWPAASQPAAYGTETTKKIAILMSDGEYNTHYNGNGDGDASAQAKSICTNMKAKGITVYAVGFELGEGSTAEDVLQSCATDPDKYFDAKDGDDLQQAFRHIALSISTLYLSE